MKVAQYPTYRRLIASIALLVLSTSLNAQMHVDATGKVGIGTDTPDQEVEVSGSGPNFRLYNTDTSSFFDFRLNATTGRFTFTDDPAGARNPLKIGRDANNNLLKIGIPADTVKITGNLIVTGTITPDYVFEPTYKLMSIEEQASYMWENKHLPSVNPGKTDANGRGVVNVGQRSQGMLEELEKAHIYVEQLNQQVKRLEGENFKQQQTVSTLEARFEALEARLCAIDPDC